MNVGQVQPRVLAGNDPASVQTGIADIHGNSRQGIAQTKPCIFFPVLTFEFGISGSTGPHESGINSGNYNVLFSKFSMHAFGKTC